MCGMISRPIHAITTSSHGKPPGKEEVVEIDSHAKDARGPTEVSEEAAQPQPTEEVTEVADAEVPKEDSKSSSSRRV